VATTHGTGSASRAADRLLDWTHSPDIAAYFAAKDACKHLAESPGADGNLAIWAINRHAFTMGRHLASRKGPDPIVRFVAPPRGTNKNLLAQDGVFTFAPMTEVVASAPVDRRPLDELDLIPAGRGDPVYVHFTLPQTEAPEVLWRLAREGVNGARCFPGFDGVVRSMREGLYWRRFRGGPQAPLDS